ncbi:hypothetical protein [Hafnia paralvei]|jgi:hypothetical protein|uniref:hypothetical protein n=1 Tax=Hafnia paralvei TaxID=546367 RepID=UPI003A101CD0
MTKLTTERLEQYAHDKHMCNINDEIREMAQKLLEYEQAAKNPVAWVVGDEEIAEFKNGREVCVMRDCDDEQLDYLPLYAAPVLPKQPELIGMKVSIDTGSDNIGHRLFGEIVGTSDSNGVPVLCIEVAENNGDMAAPAQPVIPEQPEPTISFYRDGIIAAAKWVENQRDAYDNEHGQSDPDTGAFEFGNDAQLEYSEMLLEIAEGIRSLHPASVQPVIPDNDDDDLIQRISGRAKFLRDKGEIKTPVLIEAAISALSAQPVSEPYKLEIDLDDADHFSITHLQEIIYGKELIWPEAKLLARFMLDVKQRVSVAPAQESE